MANPNSYKWCAVPMCTNTTIKTPEKLFLNLPSDEKRRRLWINAARREPVSLKSVVYYCEDHFEMEQSVENLSYVRMMKGRMNIKKTAMPTKFVCQARPINDFVEPTRPYLVKKRRLEIVNAMLQDANPADIVKH